MASAQPWGFAILDRPGFVRDERAGVVVDANRRHASDRADRRRIITLFQSIQMLCPSLIRALLAYGSIQPLAIIALSLIVGIADAFSMPRAQFDAIQSIAHPWACYRRGAHGQRRRHRLLRTQRRLLHSVHSRGSMDSSEGARQVPRRPNV